MNIVQSQMQMGMQRPPQNLNRMSHQRSMYIGPSIPGYAMLGSRPPMAMGNIQYNPKHGTQLARSTSMPGQ